MDVTFTVGEMAALNGISKQMLIFYDKEGVFKPKFINNDNSYRYYTAEQLEELDSILVLREMGLSLKEIKQHMNNRSPENALEILKKQEQAVKEKINKLNLISNRIERKIELLNNYKQVNNAFEIKEVEEQLLAVIAVKQPAGLLEVDIALKKLLQYMGKYNVEHNYQIGDIVANEDLINHNYIKFKYGFMPIIKPIKPFKHLKTVVKTAGMYAIGYHYGPYSTMGETYDFMLKKIKENGKEAITDSYEFCVFDNLTSYSPKEYCTEIHIGIK